MSLSILCALALPVLTLPSSIVALGAPGTDQSALAHPLPVAAQDAALDPFAGADLLATMDMRDAAGGTATGTHIGVLGVNIADSSGKIEGVNVSNSKNGEIANNAVTDNRGITTIFNNTGNGVLFQSTVQVNIFLNNPAPN